MSKILSTATDSLILLAAITVIFFTVEGSQGVGQLNSLDSEIKQLKSQLRHIDSEIIKTNNNIYALENNDLMMEKLARESLGLSRPGDIVYIFPSK